MNQIRQCPCGVNKGYEGKGIGCPLFETGQCPCEPNNCILYEIYRNQEFIVAAVRKIFHTLQK